MKVKIVKPLEQSGYFRNQEIEINKSDLPNIQKHNIIQIIEDLEVSTIKNDTEKAIKKTYKRGRPKKE
ncbi:hypothetical protein [Cyclobacterium plantarum]|uniref:Uncharacterized protein n=1 Tax=Cyclobacterium plantarum TaxID=2716263 RepID=A0ABX0H7U2_9BACT|nr:hypothetical protein [Cyclobacterium plantarum]NHE57960.1 hypothetical protein [Cyclobacterium plantarum]